MAKKTTKSSSSLVNEEKKWRIERNANILKEAANMTASDRREAENYIKNQIKEMQKLVR